MRLFRNEPCDLRKIAESGQCFRWNAGTFRGERECYWVSAGCHMAALMAGDTGIDVESSGEDGFWVNYLDAAFDYDEACRATIEYNPELREVYEFGRGIRILNQPWFEASVSFIASQNNNIPRIRQTVIAMCGGVGNPFPKPEKLVKALEGQTFGLGYRHRYVMEFAKKCADGWEPASLHSDGVSVFDQMDELRKFDGIGMKVSSCIALYALGYKDAYPEDVWIKRAEEEMGIKRHPSYSGIQQQLIFYWMRNRPICGDEDVKGGRR